MRLLVVRHAIAEDREEFARTGRPDAERPLTPDGRRRMRRVARGLRTLVPELDVLATSPYVRAADTAAIVQRALGGEPVITTLTALLPDSAPEALREWLRSVPTDATIAIVGHEPHLSQTVSWLLTASSRPLLELKKGGACLLSFEGDVSEGGARLEWLLGAGHLRRLVD